MRRGPGRSQIIVAKSRARQKEPWIKEKPSLRLFSRGMSRPNSKVADHASSLHWSSAGPYRLSRAC